MRHIQTSRFILIGLATLTALAANGCSSAEEAAAGCNGLDVTVKSQATVKAFADAAVALQTRALEVEGKFLAACNAINEDLGLAKKDSTADACSALKARVDTAVKAGATVRVTVEGGCRVDAKAQAECEATCRPPSCDIEAECDPGKLVVGCSGTCSGQCDVQAPSVACKGECHGECTASAAVACEGSCSGSCTGGFEGQCDVGCSAGFEGTCGGDCEGTCDGSNSSGKCEGTCKGKCSAQASGKCTADCTGSFKGSCTGQCKGSCTAQAGVMCDGTCNGTCSYTPGSAKCEGECHGECSVETSPPRCTATVDCEPADCKGNCSAKVEAKATCSKPTVAVVIDGDAELQAALEANADAWGDAFLSFKTLARPAEAVATTAGKTVTTLAADIGDIGVAGASCFTSSLQVAAKASASVNVSVSASASVSSSSSAG